MGSPFRLGMPHQTRVQTPLSEVHVLRDLGPDISGSADAQRLCEKNVGEDEGYLRVPTPTNNPPPFRGQDSRETAPYCTGGRGIPASRLGSKLAPTTLPRSVVRDSPVQVRPVVVMREVSIDSLQQQVRTFRGESRSRSIAWGGTPPP